MKTKLSSLQDLSEGERVSMQQLMETHYHGVTSDSFHADLASKSHVLRIFDTAQELIGFSTFDYKLVTIENTPIAVLYSGDTIISPHAWADVQLGATWYAAVLSIHNSHAADRPLWWLLLTSGVRTHRYLSVFFQRYAPATPAHYDPEANKLLPILARQRFGDQFISQQGIVRLRNPHQLRAHLTDIPPHLSTDPHVQLFLSMNPGHVHGDELVSLCRLDTDNLNPAGLRALRIGQRTLQDVI